MREIVKGCNIYAMLDSNKCLIGACVTSFFTILLREKFKILLNMCIVTVSKSPFITKVTKYRNRTYSITYTSYI